jgi:hypothetical protein
MLRLYAPSAPTLTRDQIVERAYFRDCDLSAQITMLDEELSGVGPRSAPKHELTARLDYWVAIARVRWAEGGAR